MGDIKVLWCLVDVVKPVFLTEKLQMLDLAKAFWSQRWENDKTVEL